MLRACRAVVPGSPQALLTVAPVQRELRELTRQRSNFGRERASVVNRVHKVLESANIKLAAGATDVMGVSGRAILQALIAQGSSPAAMAELAKGRLRNKREQLTQALEGRVQAHHRFLLSELVVAIDSLEETITHFNTQIEAYEKPFAEGIALLDTIPEVGRETADKKRAIVAVAHSILVIAYYLLSRHEPYRELGGDYFDRLRPEATAKRLVRRLEHLGYQITVHPPQEALASGKLIAREVIFT